MNRFIRQIRLFMLLSLLLGVIGQNSAAAATVPAIGSLGQIREGLSAPTRIDLDDSGNLYVADGRKNIILKFDIYGRKVGEFGGFPISGGMAVNSDGSRIYVGGEKAVSVVDGSSGKVLGYLGGRADEFGYPYDIDIDGQGFVFVADAGSLTVKIYDPQGTFQYSFGGRGTADGLFGSFSSLAVNSKTGEVFIADSHITSTIIPKVQVFDLAGKFLRKISGANGFGSTALYVCTSITFDTAGRAYFLDGAKSRLVVLGLPSTYLTAYTKAGFDAGKLQAPWDVAFDAVTNRLFVLCGDGRVEIFGIDGGQNPALPANRPPGMPVALKPSAGLQVTSSQPEFVFTTSSDEDGDSLVFQIQLLQNGTTLQGTFSFMPEEKSVRALPSFSLEENSLCSWQVRAFDGKEYSDWTAPESFIVNAIEEAPGAPVALTPLHGETLQGIGSLIWEASTDPDPGDRVVGYILEISNSPDFVSPIRHSIDITSVSLSDLPGYSDLESGRTYHWRVSALDTKGTTSPASQAGSFFFSATDLRISADAPQAKIFLGGNYGYAGRPVGEAPLLLRDIDPGSYSVVIEAPGYEPFVVQVTLEEGQTVRVAAGLNKAAMPASFQVQSLQAGGKKIKVGKSAAPFLIDFDNDGLIDLLVGDETGSLTFFRSAVDGTFATGQRLDLPVIPGAAPFVADWNNDGRKDLLVGSADGGLWLFLNAGSDSGPLFGSGSPIPGAGGKANAVPAVIDIEGDGDKDLVVGESGAVLLFRNEGTDSAPQLTAAGTLVALPGPLAPFFADWNGDGWRDLLVGADDGIYLALRQADGSFAPPQILNIGKAGKGARLFAFDMDGRNGKDLVIGSTSGEVQIAVAEEKR